MAHIGERLTIKSFAGIDSITLDIARVTVLIGPQASGKSVTAKMLYFFRSIWTTLFLFTEGNLSQEEQKERLKEQFKRFFPPETWGKEVFTLQYEFGDHKILLRRAPSRGRPSDGLILHLPSFVDDLFRRVAEYADEVSAKSPPGGSLRFRRYEAWRRIEPEIRAAVGEAYFDSQLFVPAGRAFFSNIENNVFSFISRSEKRLDPFLTQFGEFFSFARSASFRNAPRRELSSPMADALLGGVLVIEKDKEFVRTKDGRSIPLSNLSSGQQEALPLLMMLEGLADEDLAGISSGGPNRRHASYIEEPEAHLFPDYQRRVTERIVQYARAEQGGAQSVFITTHSPYVLSTLNVLLLAAKLGRAGRSKEKRVAELVPPQRWLPVEDVAVYSFSKKSCTSILDVESGLIDAEYLDAVSTSIGKTFDSLLEIEFPESKVVGE